MMRSKAFIKRLLILEICTLLLMTYGVFNISYGNTLQRNFAAFTKELSRSDVTAVSSVAAESIKQYNERIVEEVNEKVWTTNSANYRKGAGKDYKKVDTLSAYTELTRVGKTANGWSQVVINDKNYFIQNDLLTDTPPYNAEMSAGKAGEYQRYALSILKNYGWEESEILPLIKLWNRESHWNPSAHNGSSGAHGIPQALPARKMASEGSDYMTNGNTQIRWGLSYIKGRYGSPSNAWAHSCSHGWY